MPFPLNPPDVVVPSDPKAERTREEVNQHPEDLTQRMLRTRRYYRLTHQRPKFKYARGLDSYLDDFA